MKKLLSLWLLTFLMLIPSTAGAASPKSTITITPFLQEVRFLAAEPTISFNINITNNTSKSQDFTLKVLDFGSLDESGGVVFAGSDASSLIKKYGLANWLQLSQATLSLGANETKEISATIVNDEDMTPGGHYAAIIASIDSIGGEKSNEININQQLTSLILATKVGGEKYNLELKNIVQDGNIFQLPKNVTLSFFNPGNVHVVPRGTVKLVSSSGVVVAEGVINQESSIIFPEASRNISVELGSIRSTGIWPTKYQIQVDYRYEGYEQFARKSQGVNYINPTGLLIIAALLLLFGRIVQRKLIAKKPKR